MATTTDGILDAAEERMRLGGYHAVSFRDVAADVGIKSASVHYHYPQKADLGAALVERYSARFLGGLESQAGAAQSWDARIRVLRGAYGNALGEECRPCLCGLLGAEAGGLPAAVTDAVRVFFDAQVEWLAASTDVRGKRARVRARAAIATLQGGMILANSCGDRGLFDDAAAGLT